MPDRRRQVAQNQTIKSGIYGLPGRSRCHVALEGSKTSWEREDQNSPECQTNKTSDCIFCRPAVSDRLWAGPNGGVLRASLFAGSFATKPAHTGGKRRAKTVCLTGVRRRRALCVTSFAFAATYNEAPSLAAKVAAGELPPVEQRLPQNPLVLEPIERVGKYGGTLRMMENNDQFPQSRMFMYGFSLVRFADDGQRVVPGLAYSWDHNEDKSVWTFHLRKGIRWSDGQPFTVDDILFWWNEMVLHDGLAEAVPDWGQAGGQLADLVKLDDYTIQFRYAVPNPILDARLATWPNGYEQGPRLIVPAHYMKQFHPDYSEYESFEVFEEMLDWYVNMDYPVLTAWKPVEYRPGERLILERNPYYYAVDPAGNQLPYIDRVEWRLSRDHEVIKNEIITGNVDFHLRPYLDLRDLALLRQNEARGGYRIFMWDSGSGSGPLFYPNQNHPDPEKQEVYQNANFRQALSLAINRERINRQIFFGLGEITTGTLSRKAIEYSRTERGRQIFAASAATPTPPMIPTGPRPSSMRSESSTAMVTVGATYPAARGAHAAHRPGRARRRLLRRLKPVRQGELGSHRTPHGDQPC